MSHVALSLGRFAMAALLCALLGAGAARGEESQPDTGAPFAWQPLDLPRALVVRGVWSDWFRWQQALHQAGHDYDTAYATRSAFHQPYANVQHWPTNQPDLLGRYSTVVIANVDAVSMQPARVAQLQRFVEQGGGLVVLGGYWAFAKGGYAQTPLEAMLPVTMPMENRIPPQAGAVLAPSPGATWAMDYAFDAGPVAFYVQQLVPKSDATVQMTAGGLPAIITGSFGKGRVVAIALTIHGQPDAGQLPFWDWPHWPALLGHAVAWAGEGRPTFDSNQHASSNAPTTDELDMLALEPERLTDALLARMVAHPSPRAAEALLGVLCSPVGRSRDWPAHVLAIMTRYAKADWFAPLERELTISPPAGAHGSALLQLLGATRHPQAAPILLARLGDTTLRTAAVRGLGELGDAQQLPRLQAMHPQAWQASASEVLPDKVDPEKFANEPGQLLTHLTIARWRLGDPDAMTQLVSLHREAIFLAKVLENAGKRRVVGAQTIAGRKAVFERSLIHDRTRDLRTLVADLRRTAGPVPAAQQEAFIAFARQATHPDDVKWCLAAMRAHRRVHHLPWDRLAKCEDGLLRAAARTFAATAPQLQQ